MGWLSDAWREVTSGGKAQTKTFNGSPAAQSRASSSPSRPVQTPRAQSAPATSRLTIPASVGGGGGGGRGGVATAVPPRQTAQVGQDGPVQRVADARAQVAAAQAAAATSTSALDGLRRGAASTPGASADDDWMLNGIRESMQQGQDARDAARGEPGVSREAQAAADAATAQRKADATPVPEDAWWRNREPGGRVPTMQLTPEQYAGLSARQQAGVLYNTELAAARSADRGTGDDANVRGFLTELDLAPASDDDRLLGLDQAISNGILSRLDDATTRQQSAESLRYARGDESAAPRAAEFSRASGAAAQAADVMANRLSTGGFVGLRGTTQAPGFGDSQRDAALRLAYDLMVDSSVQQSPDDIAAGLATLNEANGTDISPQELWDFTNLQLRAADFGSLRGGQATVPVSDPSITPLSVQEIRQRYGL